MYCSQCGRQIPDGSRFCNYCGAEIAANDMNPDVEPEQEQYQDYGAYDAPKGFETLPYNKHGYGRQTTNSQQTQVPQGGFIQKDYTQHSKASRGGSAQHPKADQGGFAQQGSHAGISYQNPYGASDQQGSAGTPQQNPYGAAQQTPYSGTSKQNPYGASDQQGSAGTSYQNPYGAGQQTSSAGRDEQEPAQGTDDARPGTETETYGQNSYDRPPYQQASQPSAHQPWMQDFAIRPVRRKKKWLMPAVIGAALLLVLAAVLLFSCGSDDKQEAAEDPTLQANLGNWGYACKMGEDYYIFVPNHGLIRAKEASLKDSPGAPEPELIKALPMTIDGLEYDNMEDLVPAGKLLYYQISSYDRDTDRTTFRYYAYDTVAGKDQELFTVTGKCCWGLDKVGDRIYGYLDGDLFYIDTTVPPEEKEACRKDTDIRLGDDPNVAFCPEGILIAQQGNCRGLKLISPEGSTLCTYDKLKDQELYIHLVWNGYAYYHREDAADSDKRTIYRVDLETGEYDVFADQKSMGDPILIRMNAYGDRIFVGAVRERTSGSYQFGILQFFENGELRMETTMPEAPDTDLSLLCMVNVGEYMITRLVLLPDTPDIHVFKLPDMQKMQ